MARTMENKPLQIPVSKKWKGITVYCGKCKTNVGKICKGSGKSIGQCLHGESHIYKLYLHVPGTSNQRKTKNLGRDLDSAIKQAIKFEEELKANNYQNSVDIENTKEKKPEIKNVTENKPQLLINALSRYIGWLYNEDVPEHIQKERSVEHIRNVELSFKILIQSLKDNGHNISTLSIGDFNDKIIGQVFSAIEEKKFANRTFNKYFSYYTSFLKWYAEEYNFPIRNWFERVKRKQLNPRPEAITRAEYEALLKQITPENGIKEYKNGVKPIRNVYRFWLSDGIRLGLETGRRREEVINLKWNGIKNSDGVSYIVVEDYKVNRIQNRIKDEEKKLIYVPITESLQELLNEMGQEKYKNSDNFILAPEIKTSRKRVMSDILSRGFSHYYNQLETGRKLTFKCLRKTYITNLQIYMGSNITAISNITGHSDNSNVIERNYIDKKEIAKAGKGFKIFQNEVRIEELEEIRVKKESNQKNREV